MASTNIYISSKHSPQQVIEIKAYQQWLSDAFDKALDQLDPNEPISGIQFMDNNWRSPPPPITEAVLDHAFEQQRVAAQMLNSTGVDPTLRSKPKTIVRYREKSEMGLNISTGKTDRGFKAINDFMACRFDVNSVTEVLAVQKRIIEHLGQNSDNSKINYKSAPIVVIQQSTEPGVDAVLNVYFRYLGNIMEIQIEPRIASLIFSQFSKYQHSEENKKQHMKLTGQFWRNLKQALLSKHQTGEALVNGTHFHWRQEMEKLWEEKHANTPETLAAEEDREFVNQVQELLEKDLPEA